MGSAALDIGTATQARAATPKVTPTQLFFRRTLAGMDLVEAVSRAAGNLRCVSHVTDRFDLRRDIRFGTRVTAAHYDTAVNRWQVTIEAGERYDAKFLMPVFSEYPGHSGNADRVRHPRRNPDARRHRVQARHHRLCYRHQRDDRPAVAHEHSRPRRAVASLKTRGSPGTLAPRYQECLACGGSVAFASAR